MWAASRWLAPSRSRSGAPSGPGVFRSYRPDPLCPGAFRHGCGAPPHIALQTFTWMLEEILHRDSLGSKQVIRPGQVNLMTAGRGIAHTEESVPNQPDLHAAQLWIALPEADQHTPPASITTRRSPLAARGDHPSLCSSASTAAGAPPPCTSPHSGAGSARPGGEARITPSPGSRLRARPLSPRGETIVAGEALARSSCSTCPGNRGGGADPAPGRPAAAHRRRAPCPKPLQIWWNFVSVDKGRPFAPPPPTGRAVIRALAR